MPALGKRRCCFARRMTPKVVNFLGRPARSECPIPVAHFALGAFTDDRRHEVRRWPERAEDPTTRVFALELLGLSWRQ